MGDSLIEKIGMFFRKGKKDLEEPGDFIYKCSTLIRGENYLQRFVSTT